MTEADIEQAKKEAHAIIERLPHFHLVDPAHVAKWVDRMADREPERLTWHAMRQSGFSGSEVGTLVQNLRGERAHFGSARKLVLQKLFIMTPDQPNEHMLRGIETEDMHRVKFLKMWNAQRDEQAYEALSNARGRYGFLRYSPDDVVTIQGRRVLVDYKSPSDVADVDGFDFDYQCQINLGADILQHIGLPADNGMLSRLSWKEWRCVGNWVPLDRQLQHEILEAAHHYWNKFVLRGDVPSILSPSAPAQYSDELKNRLAVKSATIVGLDEVTKRIETQREALVAEMKEEVEASGAVGKASVFSHTINTVETVNAEHLADLLQTHHLDAQHEIDQLSEISKVNHNALLGDLQHDGVNLRKLLDDSAFDNPDIAAQLEVTGMTLDELVDLVSTITAGNVTLEQYATDKTLDVEKVKNRLDQLGLPADSVIDHVHTVKKSTAKKPDVVAFKPEFQAIGEELTTRLVNKAQDNMEYKLVPAAKKPVTIADPTVVLPSGAVLQITADDLDVEGEGEGELMIM